MAAVSAYYLLRKRHDEFARHGLSMAMWALLIVMPAQFVSGDLHGLNTLQYQPAKIAAIEANWQTRPGMPLVLFALPDVSHQRNRYEIGIPRLGSLILAHRLDGVVLGLDKVAEADRPYVPLPFFAFRLMVSCGVLLLTLALFGLWLRMKGRLFITPHFARLCIAATPLGYLGTAAGWIVTEAGRQPWTVYGLMRTVESTGGATIVSVSFSYFLIVVLSTTLGTWFFAHLYGAVIRGPQPELTERLPLPGAQFPMANIFQPARAFFLKAQRVRRRSV
jgi:cytochrome bd ubiquinol oxidase subunit I